MKCPTCKQKLKKGQVTFSVSEAIDITNNEPERNDSLGLCLWFNRVCVLVGYE